MLDMQSCVLPQRGAAQLERGGARLVERDMGRVDLALGATSAVIVWRPHELQGGQGAFDEGDALEARLHELVRCHGSARQGRAHVAGAVRL